MTAISATVSSFRSMADGSLRIALDFSEQESKRAKELLCDVGAAVAIARLLDATQDAQMAELAEDTEKAWREAYTGPQPSGMVKERYGQEAKALRLSAFFRTPAVWGAVGTDAEFRE